jgi:regulator of PEP synthase PpsR (kinase-PPPase family)
LGERGYKVCNIPLVLHQKIPDEIFKCKAVKVGLTIDPKRLSDVRKTRINILNDKQSSTYVNLDLIQQEIDETKKMFLSKKIPMIDVTRKSVEETAASIIKIYEIEKEKQSDH